MVRLQYDVQTNRTGDLKLSDNESENRGSKLTTK